MLRDIASLEEARRFLAAFSPSSTVGFGICDQQLRYRWINRTLAASNGVSAEAHLGNTVRDILGEVALSIEPAFQRVLVTGDDVSKEVVGEVPTRHCVVHWIASYFPLRTSGTRVQHMGAIAIEVTELKRLDRFYRRLRDETARSGNEAGLRVAQPLCDSLDQYFAALITSMGKLRQNIWQLEKSVDQQFAPTMGLLEKRLLEMRSLASSLNGVSPV
jgi:transcriptional regulator with PAS, ATPase and Fis domain